MQKERQVAGRYPETDFASVPRGSGIVAGTSQYLLRYPANSTVDSFLEEVGSRPSGPYGFCHMHCFSMQISQMRSCL